MTNVVNTEAEYLLEGFDFSGENAHIAYTINSLGGSASQVSEERPYLCKAGTNNLSKEQKEILEEIKKASPLDPSLEESLEAALRNKFNSILPDIRIPLWVDKITHDYVYYTIDFETTFYSPYTVDGVGNVTVSDEKVEVESRCVFVETEHNSDHLDMIKFAHTPDENDPLVWKFRIDSKDYVEDSIAALSPTYKGKKIELSEEEKVAVTEKITKAYKKFFPDAEELPSVLKASEINKTSGAASDDSHEIMPCGIKKEKENMSNTDNKTDDKKIVIDDSDKLADLQKSVNDMQELLKAEKSAREAAEAKADEIQKSVEAKEIAKAKEDMTELVKAWDSVDNTDEVVEALLKSDASEVLIAVMEGLHNKVAEVKKSFGETEHGVDGDIDNSTSVDKSKSAVSAALKARKELKAKNSK